MCVCVCVCVLCVQLCGLMPSPYGDDTREPLHFYLHCMRIITANVMLQFPDADDVVFWLKPLRALDVVRVCAPAALPLLPHSRFRVSSQPPISSCVSDAERSAARTGDGFQTGRNNSLLGP